MRKVSTLNKINLDEEVIIKKINCTRSYKKKTFRLRND